MCWVVYIRPNRCLSHVISVTSALIFSFIVPWYQWTAIWWWWLVALWSVQSNWTDIDVTYSTHVSVSIFPMHFPFTSNNKSCTPDTKWRVFHHNNYSYFEVYRIFCYLFSLSFINLDRLQLDCDWDVVEVLVPRLTWVMHLAHSLLQLSGPPDPVTRPAHKPTSYPLIVFSIFMGNYSLGSYYPLEYQGLFIIFSKWWKV